jgi:hypothetical protein
MKAPIAAQARDSTALLLKSISPICPRFQEAFEPL